MEHDPRLIIFIFTPVICGLALLTIIRKQQHKINNRDNVARKMLKNSYEDLMNEDS